MNSDWVPKNFKLGSLMGWPLSWPVTSWPQWKVIQFFHWIKMKIRLCYCSPWVSQTVIIGIKKETYHHCIEPMTLSKLNNRRRKKRDGCSSLKDSSVKPQWLYFLSTFHFKTSMKNDIVGLKKFSDSDLTHRRAIEFLMGFWAWKLVTYETIKQFQIYFWKLKIFNPKSCPCLTLIKLREKIMEKLIILSSPDVEPTWLHPTKNPSCGKWTLIDSQGKLGRTRKTVLLQEWIFIVA